MDLQKITSTGTAVAVIGTGTVVGGNYAVDQATGGPQKRIKAKQTEIQLIVREEVRSALAEMLPKSTGGVVRVDQPKDYRQEVPK
jgi:BRCT domain type II-containing protein